MPKLPNLKDKVVQPSHYMAGGIETIDYLKAKLTEAQFEGLCLGSALQYLSRANDKGEFKTDIGKAMVYLGWILGIDHREQK